ncbi:MAG TPA: hypothetical protein VEX62_08505 [Candidatus Limnocylindrales bacterium]|nr:hypothetical protein [Candidatus Limnocylindrales bacterium]
MNRLFVVSAFLVALLVVACGAPAATPTTAPSPTLAPTATAAPTTTVSPTASPTEAPSATPTEAPSATASAEPSESPGGIVIETDSTGAFLVAPDGYSLYVFDNDEPGVSNCDGDCLDNWPAFTSDGELTGGEGVTGIFATITRADGTTQVTYDGAPLYFFANDEAPGDTNGDGVGEVWHLAAP